MVLVGRLEAPKVPPPRPARQPGEPEPAPANIVWVSPGPGQAVIPVSTVQAGVSREGMTQAELRVLEEAARAETSRVIAITGKAAQQQKILEYEMAKRGVAYRPSEGISVATAEDVARPLPTAEAGKAVTQLAQQYPGYTVMQTGPGGELALVPVGQAESQFVAQHPGGMTLTSEYAQQQYEAGKPITIYSQAQAGPQVYFGGTGAVGIQQPGAGLLVTGPAGASYEFLPMGYDLERRREEAQKAVVQSMVAARTTALGIGAVRPAAKAAEFYMGWDRPVPEGQLAVKYPGAPARIAREATEFVTGEEAPYLQYPALIQYPYYYEGEEKKYYREKPKPPTISEQIEAITKPIPGIGAELAFMERRKVELQEKGEWLPHLKREYMETRAELAKPYILKGTWGETVEKDILPFLTGLAQWEKEEAEKSRRAYAEKFGEEEAKRLPDLLRPIAGLSGMGLMAAELPIGIAGIPVLATGMVGTGLIKLELASAKLLTGDVGGYLTGSLDAALSPFAAGAAAFIIGPAERAAELEKEFPGMGGGYLGSYALLLGLGAARAFKGKAPKGQIDIGRPGAEAEALTKFTAVELLREATSGRELMLKGLATKQRVGEIYYPGRAWGKEGSILRGPPIKEAFAEPFVAETVYLRRKAGKFIEVVGEEAWARELKGGAEAVTIGERAGLPPTESTLARLRRTITGKEPPKAEPVPYAGEAVAEVFLRAEGEAAKLSAEKIKKAVTGQEPPMVEVKPTTTQVWAVTGKARPLKQVKILQTGVRKTRAGPTIEAQIASFIGAKKKPSIRVGVKEKLRLKPPSGVPETMIKYKRSIYDTPDFYRDLLKGIELTKKEGRFQPPEWTEMKAKYTTEEFGDYIRYNLVGESKQAGVPVKLYETGLVEKFLGEMKITDVVKEPKRVQFEGGPMEPTKVTPKQLNEMLGIEKPIKPSPITEGSRKMLRALYKEKPEVTAEKIISEWQSWIEGGEKPGARIRVKPEADVKVAEKVRGGLSEAEYKRIFIEDKPLGIMAPEELIWKMGVEEKVKVVRPPEQLFEFTDKFGRKQTYRPPARRFPSAEVARDVKSGMGEVGQQIQLSSELTQAANQALMRRAATMVVPDVAIVTGTKVKPTVVVLPKEVESIEEMQKEATSQARQVEKVRTSELLRTGQIQKAVVGEITELRPMEATEVSEETLQDVMATQVQELTSLRDLQKIEEIQVQKVKVVDVGAIVTPVITKIIIPTEIIIPPFIPGLPGVSQKEEKAAEKKRRGRGAEYRPSVAAIVLGIRGKKPKQKYFTGFEVRPMIGKKSSTINGAMKRFGL